MSGHSGFVTIRNNYPQPGVNSVTIVENGNGGHVVAGNPPGEENPHVSAGNSPRAANLTGQLDVLLLRAAKNVAAGVDAKGVKAAAKAAGLPKSTRNTIVNLAKTAQDCVRALDGFTGSQLAGAMIKMTDEDGNVTDILWNKDNAAAKAFLEAQKSQVALSSALAEALGRAADFATQNALEEIMLQCDRRVAEIETLAMQMLEIVEKGGDKALEQADALAAGKISAFTSANALDKFGRAEALAAMEAEIKPLADRLAGYAREGAKSITEDEVARCREQLETLKAKFSGVLADGGEIVIGGKTVFCDRSMMKEAEKLFRDAGDKIASMHRDIIRGAMRNLVENSFPFLKQEIFDEKYASEFAKLKTGDGDTAGELSRFLKRTYALRKAARKYVENPTQANKSALESAAKVLQNMDRYGAAECLEQSFFSRAVAGRGASEGFKAALAKFKVDAAGPKGKQLLDALSKTVKRPYSGIDVAVAHLEELAGKLAPVPGKEVYVSSWVLGAFNGEQTVSSIIEARAHGYDDSEIDPDIDDSNVVEARDFGGGMFSTVTLLKLKDGSEWVFKPEMPACLTTSYSTHYHGMSKNMEFTRVNIAVQKTADALGLDDVMVKTKAGSNKGRFGMFMEKAPGLTGDAYIDATSGEVGKDKLSMQELRNLDDDGFGKAVGRMMRKFNRLMWFDILTGQGDRHSFNYLVEIDKETLDVVIKGIDNDASYGVLRTGLAVFSLPAGSLARTCFIQALNGAAATSVNMQDFMDAVKDDPGIEIQEGGPVKIDFDKVENKRLVQGLLHFCGLRSTAVPEEIDSDLYDRLVALAQDAGDGGAARTAYLDALASQLGKDSEQYKCAVKRLDECIAHARRLKVQGKVYTAGQWEAHEIQKSVANTALQYASNSANLPKMGSRMGGDFKNRSKYVGSTNFFMRDLYEEVARCGKHKNWFK